MQPQETYSRGLRRFLQDYPERTGLDRRILVEVFQNGRYVLFGGDTGVNFSGRGIALTVADEGDMRQQLRDALAYNDATGWPRQESYVEKKLGKKFPY